MAKKAEPKEKVEKQEFDPKKGKWMRFDEDKFYNGTCYQHGKPHFIANDMVDRWARRGGVIIEDGDVASDKEIKEELDAELAIDLVEEGVIPPNEIDPPAEPAQAEVKSEEPEVVADDDHDVIEEDEVDHKGKATGKKKKKKVAKKK